MPLMQRPPLRKQPLLPLTRWLQLTMPIRQLRLNLLLSRKLTGRFLIWLRLLRDLRLRPV